MTEEELLRTQYPDSLKAIIKACRDKHPNDIDAAADDAFAMWKKESDFKEWVMVMVRLHLRTLIYTARHHSTVNVRRDLSADVSPYTGPSKIVGGNGAVTKAAARSVFTSYFINGRSLGDIYGSELLEIADTQKDQAHGLLKNMRLCQMLAKIVPENKKVCEAISESKVRVLIRKSENSAKRVKVGSSR